PSQPSSTLGPRSPTRLPYTTLFRSPTIDDGILLTADTVAWLDGQVLGKPDDEADARRILRFLGGREHELWTGVCLWRRPDNVQRSEEHTPELQSLRHVVCRLLLQKT